MSSTDLLKRLNELNLSNSTALKLRNQFVKLLESGDELPILGKRLNLSVVAQSIGATRQIFYKGRGSPEIAELRALVEHSITQACASGMGHSSHTDNPTNTFNDIASENTRLQSLLKRSRTIESLIERGVPLIL